MWPAIAGAPRVARARLGGPCPNRAGAIQPARNERAECHRDGIFRPALGSRSRPRGPHENGYLTTCDRRVRLGVAPEGEPPRNGQIADRQARPGRLSSVWRCRLLRTTRVRAGAWPPRMVQAGCRSHSGSVGSKMRSTSPTGSPAVETRPKRGSVGSRTRWAASRCTRAARTVSPARRSKIGGLIFRRGRIVARYRKSITASVARCGRKTQPRRTRYEDASRLSTRGGEDTAAG